MTFLQIFIIFLLLLLLPYILNIFVFL